MKKCLTIPVSMLMMLIFAVILYVPASKAAAALADGTYSIGYTVLQGDNDSASMANDYWEKPATFTVKNGEMTMQMKVNHSSWVTSFKVDNGGGFADTQVVNSDSSEDTRVVQFKVKDVSNPLMAKIHVTVKTVDYDHDYTIRFAFDAKSMKALSTAESKADKAANVTPKTKSEGSAPATAPATAPAVNAEQKKAVAVNPQTGDTTPVTVLVALLLISSFILIRKFVKL
ncbi:heme uptake protein IsdC [Paenibacillus planticolens]|uniref:Heme uptake protein IsdC n=1 Tax=Paenibacillus planticolens TaxID=2654976 RepID=A0ABX1ZH43_9BACL|nr:heme uptake protein IsdC [Paenibacillus planticolens]NOU99415.1 heme uptake protein IsdC [Paenibacillus planticolens]